MRESEREGKRSRASATNRIATQSTIEAAGDVTHPPVFAQFHRAVHLELPWRDAGRRRRRRNAARACLALVIRCSREHLLMRARCRGERALENIRRRGGMTGAARWFRFASVWPHRALLSKPAPKQTNSTERWRTTRRPTEPSPLVPIGWMAAVIRRCRALCPEKLPARQGLLHCVSVCVWGSCVYEWQPLFT